MVMANKGLTKQEECGELIQIAAKLTAFRNALIHPDGKPLRSRLQEEIADVEAAIEFVKQKFELDRTVVDSRILNELSLCNKWDARASGEDLVEYPTFVKDPNV